MTAFAELVAAATADLTWMRYEVESNGYILTMVRFIGDSDGNAADVDPKGPVLLMPGAYQDSLNYFDELATTQSIPERLFNAGYDVWIANRRGTTYS